MRSSFGFNCICSRIEQMTIIQSCNSISCITYKPLNIHSIYGRSLLSVPNCDQFNQQTQQAITLNISDLSCCNCAPSELKLFITYRNSIPLHAFLFVSLLFSLPPRNEVYKIGPYEFDPIFIRTDSVVSMYDALPN